MDYLNTQKQVTMVAKNGGEKAEIRMVTRHMGKSSVIHIMLLTDLHMSTKNFWPQRMCERGHTSQYSLGS
jgi:hypothetical protein